MRQPVKIREEPVEYFICGFRQSYVIVNGTLLGCG